MEDGAKCPKAASVMAWETAACSVEGGDGIHPAGNEFSTEAVDAEAVKVKSLSISDPEEFGCVAKPVGTNPENDVGSTEVNCTTSSLGSKRSSSRNRHYRNHHSGPNDDETSSDVISGTSAQPVRPRSRSSEGKRSAKTEEDFPLPKYPRHHHEAADEQQEKTGESADSELDRPHGERNVESISSDDDASREGVARQLSTDESEDHDDYGDDEREDERNDGAESDSSGGIVFADDSTSSSSTHSDTSLPDLEGIDGEDAGVRSAFFTKNETEGTEAKTKTPTELPKALCKSKPKETWNAPKAILQREIGSGPRAGRNHAQAGELFRAGFYGSLFSAERLELMLKLEGHQGCVNCLNFNYSGTKLASGSDDLDIKIWNCTLGKCLTTFHSGHRANVFQAKFMPFVGVDTMIVSCARDNQVRLNELSSSGEVRSSRKLAQHRGPAHKLSMSPDNPNVVLSCGEDSYVFSIDTREDKYNRLLNVKEDGKKVPLYSIHQNPFQPQEFCVSGKDSYVRIYDIRKLASVSMSVGQDESASPATDPSDTRRATPLKKFCPHHLLNAGDSSPFTKTNVTAAVYNYNGKEILASYNDEHIYLFDSSHSDGADFIKKYEGHRNSATVKGVNFFGDRSQFVVSGSDCGHVFVWDKNTECIVNFFIGDEQGVINCLEGHPMVKKTFVPILATSGLDDDIKIWVPSHSSTPKMPDLLSTVKRNYKKRESEYKENSGSDGFIMWALLNQMRGNRRSLRGRRHRDEDDSDSEDFETEDDSDQDDGDDAPGMNCSIC